MSESTMRSRVVKILRPYHGMPVENMVGPGTPDVAYIGGWIECKKTDKWPAKADTPVRLDHELLATQKVWIRKHAKRGGKVFVLVQIELDFLLFDGVWAVAHLGSTTRDEMLTYCVASFRGWSDLEDRLMDFL